MKNHLHTALLLMILSELNDGFWKMFFGVIAMVYLFMSIFD